MSVNIVYASDEKYTKYVYISILSILESVGGNTNITVFLLTSKNNKRINLIKNLEKIYHFFKLEVICVEDFHFDNIEVDSVLSHINYATFFRFAIDSIKGVDKIIYIDVDTVMTSDIEELFCEDLEGKVVGVTSDMPTSFTKEQIRNLGLDNKYFNAGVMLIDLKKWKSSQISKKCIDLLKMRKYPCNDQDVLNIVLQEHIKWLPGKYNVQTGYFFVVDGEEKFYDIGFEMNYYIKALKSPVIVHYTGGLKPRNLLNEHPLRMEYDKMLWKSAKINPRGLQFVEYLILLIHKVEDFLIPNINLRRKIVIKIKKVINPRFFVLKNK